MAMEVTQLLLNAQSADANIRKVAEEGLNQCREHNLPIFLLSLSHELVNNDKPLESRKSAGIMLKNALHAPHIGTVSPLEFRQRKEELVQKWRSLDLSVKSQLKVALLETLSSPWLDAGHTSAQVIAKVAALELPQGEWPELIGVLLGNMAKAEQALKQSTLEALGYVCFEVSVGVLAQDQVNSILTAVLQAMNATETSNEVRLSATKALCKALYGVCTNVEIDMERDNIMRRVCDATLCPDSRVRQAAFECLVCMALFFYGKLQPCMQDVFRITAETVKEDEEAVVLQALEFWSTMCEKEWGSLYNYGLIRKALPYLVPLLLESLTKQEEEKDLSEDAPNLCLAIAGGVCLGQVAETVGDDIVPFVTPFIQENISKQDWRSREAATHAIAQILKGPSVEKLTPLVNAALGFLLNSMKDENSYVKDTTAWTVKRVFKFLHAAHVGVPVINQNNIAHILSTLIEGVKDVPNVARRICKALKFLAQGYQDSKGDSSPLSPYFHGIIEALLTTADREDAMDSRLRSAAYETLKEVVYSSTEDTATVVVHLVPVIMQKLEQTLQLQVMSSDDREKQSELQALLCGVLQVMIQKLAASDSTKPGIFKYADQMMSLFLKVFACRSGTVHEEAMLTIGSLAYVTGANFAKYMPGFYHYLEMGLQNFEEYQVCATTVLVVGDICRALDEKVLPYCDGIMALFFKDLSSDQLHRSVKPPIFTCFGDIALAIRDKFEKYLSYALPMLQAAAELTAQHETDEEYNNQLTSGILNAYTGIFQGCKNLKAELMLPYAGHVIQFVESVCRKKDNRDDVVRKAAVRVLGHLITLGANAAPLFKQASFYRGECSSSYYQQQRNSRIRMGSGHYW